MQLPFCWEKEGEEKKRGGSGLEGERGHGDRYGAGTGLEALMTERGEVGAEMTVRSGLGNPGIR